MKPRVNPCIAVLLLLAASLCHPALRGQSPVISFSASYITTASSVNNYTALPASPGTFGACSSTPYTYTFSNGSANQFKLNSFSANGSTYLVAPGASATIKLRRVNNTNVTGNRAIAYMEITAATATACPSPATLNFTPPYVDIMENLLNATILNQGTDNIFTNASNGDGNNNNIERVDMIFPSGLNTASPTQAGFVIFDRGNNNQHDPFKIVAITSLDNNGDPASFGAVNKCTGGNGSVNGNYGHPSTANGNKQFSAYVMRKDPSDTYLRISSNINQEIGGVFYTFADLGITAGQTLYGYSLLDNMDGNETVDLERCGNAVAFSSIYTTRLNSATPSGIAMYVDKEATGSGMYYYRLKITRLSGQIQYSGTLLLRKNAGAVNWKVYPTVANRYQQLKISGITDGSYMAIFYSLVGNTYTTNVRVQNNEARIDQPPGGLSPGIYWLRLNNTEQSLSKGVKIFIK